jgi:heat shock protein HtpX
MFKRILLFALTNILVVTTISIVLNLLGVRGYITAYGIDYSSLMVYCLVWGFVGSFISLLMSKFMAKMMMGVKIVDEQTAYATLVRRVHLLAKQAGLEKMPEVGIYESPEVNAFATGPSKNNSLVAVSTGLLNSMNDDEVEGVLAHEVAHIANGDMVTMALIQGVVNAFVMFLSRVLAFAISQAMRGNDDEDRGPSPMVNMLLVFVLEIFFSFLGMFVVAYFSRIREFRADAGAAKTAGRNKMIAALKRLQSKYEMIDDSQNNAIKAMKISSKKGLFALLSTHPSLDDRIRRLETSQF